MKNVLKKFLMTIIFCGCFQLYAIEEPKLILDEDDPEIAIGIKLNLPGDLLNVLEEYAKEYPSHLRSSITTQQALEDQDKVDRTEDFVAIILEAHKRDLLLTGNILGNNFFFYLNSALTYKNTAITCAVCSEKNKSKTQEYLENLGRLIQEYF